MQGSMKKELSITSILLFCIVSSLVAQTNNYLTFKALDGEVEIGLNSVTATPNIAYSKDGTNWMEWDWNKPNTKIKLEKEGELIYFKGNNSSGFSTNKKYVTFTFSNKIAASGSIMSLIDGKGEVKEIPNNYCFYKLFEGCSTLITAPDLTAETLKGYCYSNLFSGCTSLTYLKVNFTDWKIGSTSAIGSWLKDVKADGTLICPPTLNYKITKPSTWLINPHIVNIKTSEPANIKDIKDGAKYSDSATVSFSVTEKDGYEIELSAVGKTSNKSIEIKLNKTKYEFLMPLEDVELSVNFKLIPPQIYTITTDNHTTTNLEEASSTDLVKIYAEDLTNTGYELEKIFVNGKSINFYKYFCNFLMSDIKADVEITTQYKPINYKIKTGKNVYTEITTATAADQIEFTVDDRSAEDVILEGVKINGELIEIKDFKGTISMSDYISDITIEAVYAKYNAITTDENITEISHTKAQKGELIQFKIKPANEGFQPLVYVNSNQLLSQDNTNYSFSMFDNDVKITVEYQEIEKEDSDSQPIDNDKQDTEIPQKRKPTALNKVKVYPSVAKEGEYIIVSLENIDTEILTNSQLIICNLAGMKIQTIDNPQNIIKLTLSHGLYKGVLISSDKKYSFEFLITK